MTRRIYPFGWRHRDSWAKGREHVDVLLFGINDRRITQLERIANDTCFNLCLVRNLLKHFRQMNVECFFDEALDHFIGQCVLLIWDIRTKTKCALFYFDENNSSQVILFMRLIIFSVGHIKKMQLFGKFHPQLPDAGCCPLINNFLHGAEERRDQLMSYFSCLFHYYYIHHKAKVRITKGHSFGGLSPTILCPITLKSCLPFNI